MNTIEAVAEAILAAKGFLHPTPAERLIAQADARAAVAALAAQGDITPQQIRQAVISDYATIGTGAVTALLARQAAVHASRSQ